MERWKDIKGYEGLYQVSDLGRVKSFSREIVDSLGRKKTIKGKVLIPGREQGGYQNVILCLNGKNKNAKVHRLVAEAFIPNPEQKTHVNHIDGNKNNNVASNLEWVTRSENATHAINIGLYNPAKNAKKAKQTRKRPVVVFKGVIPIGRFDSMSEAAVYAGVSVSDISACCSGKRKTAKGFVFKHESEAASINDQWRWLMELVA